jgi:hypothetical protein
VLLLLACSSSPSSETRDDTRIVPEGIDVTPLAGGNGVFDVIALTLRKGARGTELYIALKNNGDVPACSAAVSVELFDKAELSLAAGIGGLLTPHFYRLTDGSGTLAACVGPGEVTVAALMDLPTDLEIDEVGTIVYRCPYFALDVIRVAGLTINQVKSRMGSEGTTYTGTLVNELDVALENPSVTIFPVNSVGRPLGVATASSALTIRSGESWAFETDSVDTPGVDYVAFPAGALGR